MGCIGQFSQRPHVSHLAQCLAAICFAGLVLTIDARPAQADLAPVPPAGWEAAPAVPHRSPAQQANAPDAGRTAQAPARTQSRSQPPANASTATVAPETVSIVTKTLELSMLAPDAFDDWDHDAR